MPSMPLTRRDMLCFVLLWVRSCLHSVAKWLVDFLCPASKILAAPSVQDSPRSSFYICLNELVEGVYYRSDSSSPFPLVSVSFLVDRISVSPASRSLGRQHEDCGEDAQDGLFWSTGMACLREVLDWGNTKSPTWKRLRSRTRIAHFILSHEVQGSISAVGGSRGAAKVVHGSNMYVNHFPGLM